MGLLDKLFRRGSEPSQAGVPGQQPLDQPPSEQYLFTLVEGIQAKERAEGYHALTPLERVFFCVWTLEAEINNGGFSQFYFNDSGDIATDVPGALRTIGASHTAAIVDRANGIFGQYGPPSDRDSRQECLAILEESATDDFEALDQAFLEYRDDLSALLADYMQTGDGGV